MRLIDALVIDHRSRVQVGGDGPDLLFLHGEGNTSEWAEIHDVLAEHFTVYAPVHPGFGGEEIPAWVDDVTDITFHTAGLLSVLELDRPLVAGVSLGGWMALDLAAHRPDLVGGLLAIGALGLRPNEPMPDIFIKQAPEAVGYLAESIDGSVVDPLTGDIQWSSAVGGFDSSPVDGLDGNLYLATLDGELFQVSLETGEVGWNHVLGGRIHGTPLMLDGHLYVGSTDRDLFNVLVDPPAVETAEEGE